MVCTHCLEDRYRTSHRFLISARDWLECVYERLIYPHLICSILQVDRRVDGNTYDSIATQKAVDLVRATRMGSLCYPTRGLLKGGSETVSTAISTRSWEGSEFTSFLMTAGAVTNTHIDMHVAHDREFDVPAAGTMWSVNRDHVGPAKRAIVMCSHDKERVIQALRLNTTKTATTLLWKNQDTPTLSLPRGHPMLCCTKQQGATHVTA